MDKFTDEEANLIIAGLDMIVKAGGLGQPAQFMMAHGIAVKLQEAAKDEGLKVVED